jgi:hypothetical protein
MGRNGMNKKMDNDYTDDVGEMYGAEVVMPDFLPLAHTLSDWPVRVFETLPDGTERTLSYRYGGNILAVRLEKPDAIILEFDDGRTIEAHLSKDFHLLNSL